MSLKSETVRVLSNVEMKAVGGGGIVGSAVCAAAGGNGNPSSSIDSVGAYNPNNLANIGAISVMGR